MNKKRPVNLELRSLKFPAMAIASILHRISGVALFLLLPAILLLLGKSLHSQEGFLQAQAMLAEPCYKLIVWAFATALWYHIYAGCRHLLMDLGFGETVCCARMSAMIVIGLSVLSTIMLGVWIW